MDTALEILMRIFLVIGLLVGMICIPLGLSGTFIVLGVTAVYDLLHGFHVIGIPLLLLFLGLCVVGEVIESFLGSVMARRFGAGKWGMVAAFVGGIVGAVVGNGVVPIVGALIGSFLGAFVGATAAEWAVRSREVGAARDGLRAGYGAFVGKVAASVIKMGIGAGIAVTALIRAF